MSLVSLGLGGSPSDSAVHRCAMFSMTTRPIVTDMALSKAEEHRSHLSQIGSLFRGRFASSPSTSCPLSACRPARLHPPFICLCHLPMPPILINSSKLLRRRVHVPVHPSLHHLIEFPGRCLQGGPCGVTSWCDSLRQSRSLPHSRPDATRFARQHPRTTPVYAGFRV